MQAAVDTLLPENHHAWTLFHQCATRFLADTHAGGVALARLTADLSAEEFSDLLERFNLLYDVLCPPPPASKGS